MVSSFLSKSDCSLSQSDYSRRRVLQAVSCALLPSLAGCGGGVGAMIAPAPIPSFDLLLPVHLSAMTGALRGILGIAEPTALRWLDSERMVVKPSNGEVTYLGAAQWSDRLPRLLQARLIEAFERARFMRQVVRTTDGVPFDMQLMCEVRGFEVRSLAVGYEAAIELSVRLVSHKTGRIMAAQLFFARAPVADVDGAVVARAFNQAFAQIVPDILRFVALSRT